MPRDDIGPKNKTAAQVYQCSDCKAYFNWAQTPPAQEVVETVKLGLKGQPGPATMGRFYCPGCKGKHPDAKVIR